MARVNPQTFFSFCARHGALLAELCAQPRQELSEARLIALVESNIDTTEEQPTSVLRQLQRLRILTPADGAGEVWLVAPQVATLMRYLLDEARPTTSSIVTGFIESLGKSGAVLKTAIDAEDFTRVALAVEEITETLDRIYRDASETHSAILREVMAFRSDSRGISVREKFQKIVHWMEHLVGPMMEIIRTDGPMEGAFEETSRLLRRANERALFSDLGALERTGQFLRFVRRHAHGVFEQCRREIWPLYQSLLQSSRIAAGAAVALERLRQRGRLQWGMEEVVEVFSLRFERSFSDSALALTLGRVINFEPAPPPIIDLTAGAEPPSVWRRREWLERLPAEIEPELPVEDLLAWLIAKHREKPVADLFVGFTRLLYHDAFEGTFAATGEAEYQTADAAVRGYPLMLSKPRS
jgi:hypothetical protein